MCVLLTTCSTLAPLRIMMASLKSGRSNRKWRNSFRKRYVFLWMWQTHWLHEGKGVYLLFSSYKCKSEPGIPTTSPEGSPGSTSSHSWNMQVGKKRGWIMMNSCKHIEKTETAIIHKHILISDLMTTLLGLRARRSTSSMEIWSTLLYTCKCHKYYEGKKTNKCIRAKETDKWKRFAKTS